MHADCQWIGCARMARSTKSLSRFVIRLFACCLFVRLMRDVLCRVYWRLLTGQNLQPAANVKDSRGFHEEHQH